VRRVVFAVFSLLLLAGSAPAQDATRGNMFLGYSYTNLYLTSNGRTNLNGWNASVEGKILSFVGVVADFSGHYGHERSSNEACPVAMGNLPDGCVAGNTNDASEYVFLFGVRGSVPVGRFRPFAEALFGATHLNVNGSSAEPATSTTSFAQALGAGIDCRLTRLLGWRVMADDLHTGSFAHSHNNLRLSTGVTVRF